MLLNIFKISNKYATATYLNLNILISHGNYDIPKHSI